jgi:SAM-dependent methyltransferase
MLEKRAFSFGENWQSYIEKDYTETRLVAAQQHLLEFLAVPDLKSKYLLDVGSGSGLHSAAAFRAGAARVVSFDVDPASVAATRSLWRAQGCPANWQIHEGSILDAAFLATLEPADIVYSWGVLHHTGKMWEALRNTRTLLKPDGALYIALYVTGPKSQYWTDVKKDYNRATALEKRMMEAWTVLRHAVLPKLIRLQNPLTEIRNQGRGMTFMVGVRDWLGGYPYEDATVAEVLKFCRGLDLEMANIRADAGFAEYLFAPRSAVARASVEEARVAAQRVA